jgi:hypothetical protein
VLTITRGTSHLTGNGFDPETMEGYTHIPCLCYGDSSKQNTFSGCLFSGLFICVKHVTASCGGKMPWWPAKDFFLRPHTKDFVGFSFQFSRARMDVLC